MKKKKKSLMEDKRNNEAQKPHTRRNPQKAHLTGEFVVVSGIKWWPFAASFGL